MADWWGQHHALHASWRSALERAAICSNDLVCADHEPYDHVSDRATHCAACHGCLQALSELSYDPNGRSKLALHDPKANLELLTKDKVPLTDASGEMA